VCLDVSACDLTNLTRPMCGVCVDFAYLNIYVHEKKKRVSIADSLASVALSVTLQYALPGYGERRVWVRDPGLPDHCVRL